MPEPSLLQRLKERKLVQWALAYLAGAFVVFQLLDALETPFGLTATIQQGILVVVGIGFFITLVLAWYHGEKGRQRVSGPELLMVAALFLVAGVALTLLRPQEGSYSPVALEGDDRPGIAVFPCENWSPDPEDAYFANGIHDEILLRLSKVSGLRSIGRESMEWYRENPRPMRQVAQELAVGFLGECSVLKDVEGNQVRLTFQLLDGNTGAQIWAESYEEDLTARQIFDIHSDIARRVAQAVGTVLTGAERERIEARPTESLPALNAYLLGRHSWNLRTTDGLRTAIRYFEEALEEDSTFAPALAGLAAVYGVLPAYDPASGVQEYRLSEEIARQAIAQDPALADGHVALGKALQGLWRWDEAEDHFRRALELDPGLATAHVWYGENLLARGLVAEALKEHELGARLDPYSAIINRDYGECLWRAGRYEEAVQYLELSRELNPSFASDPRAFLFETLRALGRGEEAIASLLPWVRASSPNPSEDLNALRDAIRSGGLPAVNRVRIRWLESNSWPRQASHWFRLACRYAEAGRDSDAIDALEQALSSHESDLRFILSRPEFASLMDTPRFIGLITRIGLLH